MKDGQDTPDDKRIEVVINRALQELGEMGCASARIFVTYLSPGAEDYTQFSKGMGNGFATKGQVKDWIAREDEVTRNGWDEEDDDDDDPSEDKPA